MSHVSAGRMKNCLLTGLPGVGRASALHKVADAPLGAADSAATGDALADIICASGP